MPNIKWIDPSEASGEVAEYYSVAGTSDIMRCFSVRPDFGKHIREAINLLHFSEGALSRRDHEAIAAYVSGVNRCPY